MNQQIKIQHLLWRGGFGLKLSELPEWTRLNTSQAVDKLFQESADYQEIILPNYPIPNLKELPKMPKEQRRELLNDIQRLIRNLKLTPFAKMLWEN
jgi:hypothetical protein